MYPAAQVAPPMVRNGPAVPSDPSAAAGQSGARQATTIAKDARIRMGFIYSPRREHSLSARRDNSCTDAFDRPVMPSETAAADRQKLAASRRQIRCGTAV